MNDATRDSPLPDHPLSTPDASRRDFVKKVWATLIGAAIGVVPLAAGLVVFADPLRRGRNGSRRIRVATKSAVPADGKPRLFTVRKDRQDAWNRYRNVPVGAVYLVRHAADPETVIAFNTICPHLGCFVKADNENGGYFCPCHKSEFLADGSRPEEGKGHNVAPRGLDRLEATIEGEDILVRFQNFLTGKEEQIPS